MAKHTTTVCPHGRQIRTCECPSHLKAVLIQAVCPLDCIEPSEAEPPFDFPDEDHAKSRSELLEGLKSDWILLNDYLATSEEIEIFEPLERVLDALCELAELRLDGIDPKTRNFVDGRIEEALRGGYAEQIRSLEFPPLVPLQ